MNRRDFFKLGAAAGAGAVLNMRNAAGSPIIEAGAGIPQGSMTLPEHPGFKTKHLVNIIYGSGVRKKEVIDNPECSPCQFKMIREGTLSTEDYGDTANLHGYMYTEVLTGRDAPSQRPLYPTWNEYIRKKSAGKATDYWMMQGVSYSCAWTWDVKHFSGHPEYGVRFGAMGLTMNKLFFPGKERSPAEMTDLHIEQGLGHSPAELKQVEEWIADVIASKRYELPSTREPVIERELQIGDAMSLHLAGQVLKEFKPRVLTIQVLAMDDAHVDFGFPDYNTDYGEYIKHIKTTDELIGKLWGDIQVDPYFRENPSLILRPECGRDDEVNIYGQLGHSAGDYHAHNVWMMALGPDFKKGHVVEERVQRRDLAPTITYLMTGENAEYADGHVRTQLFRDEYHMPQYELPHTAEVSGERAPVLDWEAKA